MTDEQLVRLMDTASERLSDEFEQRVESVRVGTVIAHDAKAARRWMSRPTRGRTQQGATGQALERAVANIALIFPEHVVHGSV